jgi:phage FluMu protein Com
MYEIICPACRRMIEVPAQVVVIGARSKCPKCWTILETISEHPLRVAVSSSSSTGTPIRAKSNK